MLLWRKRPRAERPPIIVKNGSIEFESAPIGRQPGWVEDGSDHWIPDQPDADDINGLKVSLFRGTATGSWPVEAREIKLVYREKGGDAEFTVKENGKKPRVKKKHGLNRVGKKLKFGSDHSGRIVSLHARGNDYQFTSDDIELWISFT